MGTIPILFLNHVSFISGAEESLLALLSALDRSRYSPLLACPPGDLASEARAIGVEVLSFPVPPFRRTGNPLALGGQMLQWVAGKNQFRKIVEQVRPRIIHSNSPMAQIYAGPIAARARIPCVLHCRDLRPIPFPAKTLCRQATRIVAVSHSVAEFMIADGFPRRKVSHVPNGIDPEAWRRRVTGRDIRAELGLEPGTRLLLMAAQFVPWKRHEDAIRAMPAILSREPLARLVLAGSDLWGAHSDLVAGLCEMAREIGVADAVIFAGYRRDVPDLMNTAELVLIPSDAEPFGRTAIEAMALAKPVVGTRAGGLPEVVRDGETGLLVAPRFPESLAAACLSLLENADLARRLGEAGRRRVEEEFHIRRTVASMDQLYQTLLKPSLRWMPV